MGFCVGDFLKAFRKAFAFVQSKVHTQMFISLFFLLLCIILVETGKSETFTIYVESLEIILVNFILQVEV